MLNTAIIGMGNWGRTLVNSVQGRNGAGIRFVAGTTGTLDKARDYAAERAYACTPLMPMCWPTRRCRPWPWPARTASIPSR